MISSVLETAARTLDAIPVEDVDGRDNSADLWSDGTVFRFSTWFKVVVGPKEDESAVPPRLDALELCNSRRAAVFVAFFFCVISEG